MSILLVSKMAAGGAGRKTGDPVQLPDDSMRADVKQIDVLAKREVTDARIFFHDQSFRENPGKTDRRTGVNSKAELVLQERPPPRPRKKQTEKHQQAFHRATSS